ncbi:sugar kinase [Kaistella solincola]|uniref:Bifunctional NAD(P)H-hydrate repair enzyme n=1 Tax=Kaistella solincola TaxID=510955 RepID=A0ABR4ZPR7_9FLAO|nr:bifunctional ADP-dependent NAD(P)H-hydrate dehydratase/NAD(P)H-hydrate epimerase [Kaistella solincola]KIA83087.1 sugar kinase [Kaistella solincola]
MNIFSAQKIYEWEIFTMQQDNISALQLMEKAAKCCCNWITDRFSTTSEMLIFCGAGNNAGDGFALARLLYQTGFNIKIFTDSSKKFTEEAEINFQRCKEISGIEIQDFSALKQLKNSESSVIIDALFGLGINRAIQGPVAEVISFLNELPGTKIALDLPSGLFAEEISAENAVIFQADYTLTFQVLKKAMLHPETAPFCGEIIIMDIGLNPDYCLENPTLENTVDENLIQQIYKPRKNFSHKGSFGKSLLIAGSFGKIGAAVLATKAALKAGSGLTFILAPNCGYEILQNSCPEAMFISGGENEVGKIVSDDEYSIGIGPGLGTAKATDIGLLNFLKSYSKSLIVDADALNILAKNAENFQFIPRNSIITPHPKEFERLFGKTENSFERTTLAQKKAAELGIFIVLKDHHTQIISPAGEVFYNLTGNSGMAKGGSGDALLGILTALVAQNYSPLNAAIFGVWLHGKAGDFAAEKYSKEALLPSDLIDELGNCFKYLEKKSSQQN